MSAEEIIHAIDELPEAERRKVYLELEQKRRSDPAAQLSAHDRAKHLIGSIDGPSDLSSNKAKPRTAGVLAESPLVGLWKNRDDLGDSGAFARRLREQAQRRRD